MGDFCDAELVPAVCEENVWSHLCMSSEGHQDRHRCACSHQWTEPDQ